jgi:hypothetical protein
MAFALRHPVSILAVAAAVLVTTSVFLFARPQHEPRYESKMIDFATQDYYSPVRIRQT